MSKLMFRESVPLAFGIELPDQTLTDPEQCRLPHKGHNTAKVVTNDLLATTTTLSAPVIGPSLSLMMS